MEAPVQITIDGKPVAKGRGRVGKDAVGNARVFTPSHTRKFETLIRAKAGEAMAGRNPIAGPLSVSVWAFLPVPVSWSKKKTTAALAGDVAPESRPDLDNYVKAAIDGMNEIVFPDDSRVVECYARKLYAEKPQLVIVVRPFVAVEQFQAHREAAE